MLPLLIDLDGVLKIGKKAAPGIEDFFEYLKKTDRKCAIISNSTLTHSREILKFFEELNIEIPYPLMTAADAALNYVKENFHSVSVYCSEPVKSLFKDFENNENPQAVIIGDMGKNWNYEIMLEIFKKVKNGAKLIAMQKNRFWKTPEDGLLLDVGPFVKAIEYASETEAVLIGKPSELYFHSGLKISGADENEKFLMLGDDLETDIGAAQKIGGIGILIYTGKTKYPLPTDSKVKPDFEVMNLNETITILNENNC
ncbi:MAG: HAD hydrolase-like protein [Melioribacteraceae bacterium]|nr:HAD hydrolase-like protein [Melioribacteraceae bacterium]MCF8355885.1 HAD hydrolase-like protein [Melioribacteraceae bacterium]MCF8395206.1 HAD hydrolase-like protein [Melioribacteraceae bacterium]MCF8420680.1 HAD hydrolase-like protein [Melioribacteraceae bacterium]